jgi:hypothetical protein
LFINSKWQISCTPEFGEQYRILLLVGNSGAAPVSNGFAEFFMVQYPYGSKALNQFEPEPLSVDNPPLGVGTFSLPGSIGGRDLAWVLSPTWARFLDPPFRNFSIAARVFEPITDGPAPDISSWLDRKCAVRIVNVNFIGTWTGSEVNLANEQQLGDIELEVSSIFSIKDGGDSAWAANWRVKIVQIPPCPGRTVTVGQSFDLWGTDVLLLSALNNNWTMSLRSSGSSQLLLQGASESVGAFPEWRTHATLKLVAPRSQLESPDKGLLSRVRKIISPNWPDDRKADARMLYAAIEAL